MERRRPRNKQQAQCGVDPSRRARRLRAAPPRRAQPVHGPGGGTAAASLAATEAANAPAKDAAAQVPEKPPMRCAFGATRAGALLGRLRLHLQTERFLAVRRDDAMWEAACLVASVALGEMVAALSESEMQAPLPRQAQPAASRCVPNGAGPGGTPCGAVVSTAPCNEGAR
jgi:hypothetical protein